MSDHTQRERISRLLIVEDDKSQLHTLTDIMGEEGFEVIACETAADALEQLNDPDFGVAIVDLRLPDLGGTELLEKIRRLNGQVQVIIHTGYGSYDSAKAALNLGAFAYVEKLGEPSQLIGHVHRAFRTGMNRYADELETAVAKRTEAEVALRESEARLRSIVESEPECVQLLTRDGRVSEVNPAGLVMMEAESAEQVCGKSAYDFVTPEYHRAFEKLNERVFNGEAGQLEFEIVGLKGTRRWMETRAAPLRDSHGEVIAQLAVTRDISERKLADERSRSQEAEMARMARMSTLGELAAGIAHEINQPLAAIANFTGAALQRVRGGDVESDALCHTLEQTARMAERAGKIIHRIKDLVGNRVPHRSTAEVNELLRDALTFVSDDLRIQDVSLRLELTENLPLVNVDAIQIQQVILNLVNNAVEALRQPGLTKRHVILRTQRSEGGVEVVVEDTGPGIDSSVAEHLFEPFVTTKGEGLGMGLAISASIIRAHKGRLWDTAHEDGGAAFHFTLPTIQQESES